VRDADNANGVMVALNDDVPPERPRISIASWVAAARMSWGPVKVLDARVATPAVPVSSVKDTSALVPKLYIAFKPAGVLILT
jgi:hypothetical protein